MIKVRCLLTGRAFFAPDNCRARNRAKKTLRFRLLPAQPSCAFAWSGWLIHEAKFNSIDASSAFRRVASKYAARGIAPATCARRARLTMTLTRARQARLPSP